MAPPRRAVPASRGAPGHRWLPSVRATDLERLDPALIRPGRVDVIHHIGHASPSQCRRMFLKFFPGRDDLAESFVAAAGHTELSMALLQSFFMQLPPQ